MRRRNYYLAAILGSILLYPVAFSPSSVSGLSATQLGVFRGSGKPDQVAKYEDWLGQSMTYAIDYTGREPVDAEEPWDEIDNPSWVCGKWQQGTAKLILSVAMLPNSRFTLAAGAKGTYDDHWRKFGKTMVQRGCGDATIRLGWEFNAKFYPWAAGGKEASFVSYFRRIVDVLREVPGEAFLFEWCPLAGVGNADVEAAWPGKNYVDLIGLDAYDTARVGMDDPQQRWDYQLKRVYGLNWLDDFAATQGKPISFPEWGVTNRTNDDLGGGDNPTYIRNMWNWFNTHNVAYAAYFEYDADVASHRLMTQEFPKSSSEYRKLVTGAK